MGENDIWYSEYANSLFRNDEGNFSSCSPGYAYEKGFGWADDSDANDTAYLSEDGGVDRTLTEEEAQQWIRDHYHEEPVNFFKPTRHLEDYFDWEGETRTWIPKKKSPSIEEMKKALGEENHIIR